MVSDIQTNARPTLIGASLNLYRRTIKRVKPLHGAAHWLLAHTLIPFLERWQRFETMPDDPFWFRLELLTNRHEGETTAHIRNLTRPGMTVLDIGGHVGYYTRLMSSLVGSSGRVITFEPHPRNMEVLRRNVASASNVTTLQVALAEREGTAVLHDYLMMSASGSLHYDESIRDVQRAQIAEGDIAPRARDFQPQEFTVRTARVDDLLAEQGIQRVDVVKMDIEGAELGALRGMQATIQRSPHLALVMEYNPLGLQAFGHNPADALQEVLAMGFQKLYLIQPDATLTELTDNAAALQQLTEKLVQNMGVINVLFVRQP